MGILGFLASVLLPMLVQARRQASLAQCTNNLRQLGQALMMYNIDHSRDFERYPDRLTHLCDLGYVRDARVFICPLDYTHATKNQGTGRTALKPGTPGNDYNYWAERDPPISPDDWLRLPNGSVAAKTYNCSYIYEFSTRTNYLGSYASTVDPIQGVTDVSWTSSGWASDTLVSWYSDNRYWDDFAYTPNDEGEVEIVDGYDADGFEIYSWIIIPANPMDVDRDGNGVITWQEAKFWQLQNADVYITGYAAPGERNIPTSWSSDPYDNIRLNGIDENDSLIQREYPRGLMPIVRCFWHVTPGMVDSQDYESVLNLAVDGNTFFSAPGWEQTAWRYGRGVYGAATAGN